MKRNTFLCKRLLLLLALSATWLVGAVAQETPRWLRYAQISPDGNQIAFCYQGDIYIVDAIGGEARLLTGSDGYESHPTWSPDGKRIAFMSNRDGHRSIYTMSALGGDVKRITHHSGNSHTVECYTPDGRFIIMSESLQQPATSALNPSGILSQLYMIPVDGGTPMLYNARPLEAVTFSHRGDRYVAQDIKGFENKWRKHHTSSVTRDIYIVDPKTGATTACTLEPGEDLSPVFGPDDQTVFFISERGKSNSLNVWKQRIGEQTAQQVTSFRNHPVRFLSISRSGRLCFAYDGDLYTMTEGRSPQKVQIILRTEGPKDKVYRRTASSGGSSFTPSSDGKQLAFIMRGDVYVTSVEHGTTKRITQSAGAEESVTWSPDSKTLVYDSRRDGKHILYKATIASDKELDFASATIIKEEPLMPECKMEQALPQYSPDGKLIAFVGDRKCIYTYNVESKKLTQVTSGKDQPEMHGYISYEWSPDSRWIAFGYTPNVHAPFGDVGLVRATGGEVINLTNTGYFSDLTGWVMEGNAILFTSDRYGMRNHASWGSMSDAFLVFLNRKAYEKFSMTPEERDLYDRAGLDTLQYGADPVPAEDSAKKKDETKPIIVEIQGIEDRIVRLTPNSSDLADAYVDADGKNLYYLSAFEGGYNLWQTDLREGNTSMLRQLDLSGSAYMRPTPKGDKIFVISSGRVQCFTPASKKFEPVNYRARVELDSYAEREAMYDFMVREEGLRFYRTDMHGVDWKGLTDHYRQFLPHIATNEDFSEMLSEILGELNVSHTGSGYRQSSSEPATGRLGLLYNWYSLPLEGIIVDEIVTGGPFDTYLTKLQPGDRIVAINGTRIDHHTDWRDLLAGTTGTLTAVTFYSNKEQKEITEAVRPISSGRFSGLLYKRWVKAREAEVQRLSNGRLGYVHIPSMGDDEFRTVYSEVMGKYYQCDGIVIDIRYNGGGRLHEDLETFFSGKAYLQQEVRGQDYCTMPSKRWTKPSVMLVCEADYSNAHGSPWVYQTLGMGKVVGMPVPGTMTSVNWVTMQNPLLFFGIPAVGYRTQQGDFLENKQLEPDVVVPLDYNRVLEGHDSQLEAAVRVLLEEVKAHPQPTFPKR